MASWMVPCADGGASYDGRGKWRSAGVRSGVTYACACTYIILHEGVLESIGGLEPKQRGSFGTGPQYSIIQ